MAFWKTCRRSLPCPRCTMSEALAFAMSIVQSVLAASGVPRKRARRPPSPKAVTNAPGKLVGPDNLKSIKARKAAAAAMRPYQSKLTEAGIRSETEFLAVIEAALTRMIADGTTSITVSSWIGAILEVEGPKHPFVREYTREVSSASIAFANEAIA